MRKISEIQTGSYYSEALGCERNYSFLLPPDREDGEYFPLLILLHGQNASHKDWFERTQIVRYSSDYRMIAACPDGADGWYTDAFDGNADYERDVTGCFFPHLMSSFPIHLKASRKALCGISMGGYGALKIALKNPELFGTAVSISGGLDITSRNEVHSVFGDPEKHRIHRRMNSISFLAEDALSRFPSERTRIYICCGLNDPLLEANRMIHNHLLFSGYGHTYYEWPGYHTWTYWNRAIKRLLPDVANNIGAGASGEKGMKNERV